MTLPRRTAFSRFAGFSRRLGMQAAASAIVMVALHGASLTGYDLDSWLSSEPDAPAEAVPERPAPRVVGVPRRFDVPAQAGDAIEEIARQAAAAEPQVSATPPVEAGPTAVTVAAAAPVVAPAHVAVPSPRPSQPAVPAATRRDGPERLFFDVSPREVLPDEGGAVELVAFHDEVPAPPEPEGGFTLGSIVPSGSALLRGAGEVTGAAADLVAGTASRVVDLVR